MTVLFGHAQHAVRSARALRHSARVFSGRWYTTDDSLEFDVCVVGAGVAGLSSAIRLKQLAQDNGKDVSVCVLEKGKEVGSHILSGCVMETRSLDELFPGWKDDASCPVKQKVTRDSLYFFSRRSAIPLPKVKSMRNKGNYVVSLSQMTRWLGKKAEELGVEIFPGFPGQDVLLGGGVVQGVRTGEFGRAKTGEEKASYVPGIEIKSKVTLLAEGCRGSLSEKVIQKYSLRDKGNADPQTYALGIKEIWRVNPSAHKPGHVWHSIGYPLPHNVHGGAFCYHMGADTMVSLGLVVALDYSNPNTSPYGEFQKLKRHPKVARLLEGGECIEYGARCLNEGGLQSLPHLEFPGGALLGDSAGFLNAQKIKGVHTAMKSGIIAAEKAFDGALSMHGYDAAVRHDSWICEELYQARNIRPGFSLLNRYGGLIYAALDSIILRGKAPWTLRMHTQDHEHLSPIKDMSARDVPVYPAPDGITTFDISDSLYRSGTNHEHDQPSHLRLKNPKIPSVVNAPLYGGPEEHYCPAAVYQYTRDRDGKAIPPLQIHAQNCLHCKACDIKDPLRNITWIPPEGGGGPSYSNS